MYFPLEQWTIYVVDYGNDWYAAQDAGGRAGGGCNFCENGECDDGESAQTCFWEQMSMQALVLRGGEQNLFLYPALKQAVLKAKRGLMPQHGREKDAYCLVEVPLRYRE